MVDRYNEIAEKMPWIKKKDNPKKPWDNPAQEAPKMPTSRLMSSKDDVITKVKNIQEKLNSLTKMKEVLEEEKLALNKELGNAEEKLHEKENIIGEKETNVKELSDKVELLEKEKEELIKDLDEAREEVEAKNVIIDEKEKSFVELKGQIETLEKEKEASDSKLNDLQKALKTATSEKQYLENELAAADKAISEINNLLTS